MEDDLIIKKRRQIPRKTLRKTIKKYIKIYELECKYNL